MQKDDLKTIGFATAVCLVCSLGLAGIHSALKPLQEHNVMIDGQINVLKALNPDFAPDGTPLSEEQRVEYFVNGKVPKAWIPQYFSGFVSTNQVVLSSGTTNNLYVLTRDGAELAYAFPAEGKGLWSTVYSYIGLEPDMNTVRGVTFFGHKETPGLGGECSNPPFQRQWRGDRFLENGEFKGIRVVKGAADAGNAHAVDGMSGATITGNGIDKFVNSTFKEYDAAVFSAKRRTEGAL